MSEAIEKVGSLADFITGHSEMHPELPLVHSTLVEYFRTVATAGALNPRNCPVFLEPLVYLFYGRPAYRSSRGVTPNTAHQHCPVCFIFKPTFLQVAPVRIYPFDTGAAMDGRFAPHIDASSINNYMLHPSLDSIQKFVHTFFETNGAYLFGTPRAVLDTSKANAYVMSYYSLVSHEGVENYDDRRSAIELQYRDPIPLRGTLWAVAMPTSFLEHADIRNTVIRDWGAFPLTYNFVRGTAPVEYYPAIRTLYERWLREGYLL